MTWNNRPGRSIPIRSNCVSFVSPRGCRLRSQQNSWFGCMSCLPLPGPRERPVNPKPEAKEAECVTANSKARLYLAQRKRDLREEIARIENALNTRRRELAQVEEAEASL